jgi:hypothetical protein
VHFNSKLEEIIQALALRLGFRNVVAPNITVCIHQLQELSMTRGYNSHSMSPDQDGVGVRVLVHGLLQASGEILLECSVLDDRNLKCVEEAQHALALASRNTLDLLNVADLEASIWTLLALDQERHQNGPLGVRVNAAAGTTLESSKEQRSACGRLQFEGLADVLAVGRRVLGSRELQDKDIVRLNQFLLNS